MSHRARVIYRIAVHGDVYAVGYEGNWFVSKRAANNAIRELRGLGFDWDHDDYKVIAVVVSNLSAEDRRLASNCGLKLAVGNKGKRHVS